MKISILLPTRNRLHYLRSAVETVRRQDYDNWEIIVSDNDSEDDIAGFCNSLGDSRIRYFRTASFVPVTENWNNALNRSTGDYVIMLGDDDGLMRGYLKTMSRLVGEYHGPDLIYTGAFIYAYPGVMPDFPGGYLQRNCNPVFESEEPMWLAHDKAIDLVTDAMQLRMRVAFNMQHSLLSRQFIDSLRQYGPFFQSPYPDFYATNVAFLKARRILVYQRPLIAIGITPKSYGFFHFNHDEGGGMEFLKNSPDTESTTRLAGTLLPGNRNNTSWLLAMSAIEQNYGPEFGLKAGYRHYRFLQIAHAYKTYYLDARLTRDEFEEVAARMRPLERLFYGLPMRVGFALVRLVPASLLRRLLQRVRPLIGQYIVASSVNTRTTFNSIIDVFEAVDPLTEAEVA